MNEMNYLLLLLINKSYNLCFELVLLELHNLRL